MEMNCLIILDSRVVVPVPLPAQNSIYGIMELDGGQYPEIDDFGYRLPHDLHQDNYSEVGASPLGVITTVLHANDATSYNPLKAA